MSWYKTIFLHSKTDVANDGNPSENGTTVTLNPVRMDLEYDFMCGICHGFLIQPRMCPFCRYKSCEKCFETWFQQLVRLVKLPSCPQCRAQASMYSLVVIPSLDELDKRLNVLEESNKKLETTLAELLADFTKKITKMEEENKVKLNEIQEFFVKHMQEHRTEVNAAIDGLKTKLDVLKRQNVVSATKHEVSSVKENQKPINSKKIMLPSSSNMVTRNASSKHSIPTDRSALTVPCELKSPRRAPLNSVPHSSRNRVPVLQIQKVNENNVPSNVSKTQKSGAGSQAKTKAHNTRSFVF